MNTKVLNGILVGFIVVLALIVSSFGFFSNKSIYEGKTFQALNGEIVNLNGKGLYYNDSVSMAAQARAQDIVTLVIGIPFLIFSFILANRKSIKGKLLLTGIIGYFLYTYASYSFLAMYNKFFLIYVTLMSVSFFAFVLNITSGELKGLKSHFNKKLPRKFNGIFDIFMGVCICLLWLGMIVPTIGKAPSFIEHYTTLPIQAMDLGFIVPTAILSGILLIKNKSLGYLLTSVIVIKGVTLLLAVVMMVIFQIKSGVDVSIFVMIMFPSFLIILVINLFLLLRNLGKQ